MTLNFSKYQGTGNDFILIDNRQLTFPSSNISVIEKLCHRKFGVGADGLMLLQNKAGYDFEMVYFNADGRQSSMCGNGGRCIAAFAASLDIINQKGFFWAIDGEHLVEIKKRNEIEMEISLKMTDVVKIKDFNSCFVLDTGSPHYIMFTENIENINVTKMGKQIRNSESFLKDGINVNFVEVNENVLKVRTYERGVEDETLSCGTGVTAAVLAAMYSGRITNTASVDVKVPGGNLKVYFSNSGSGNFSDIWLEGPATFVFSGKIDI
ncbi:MAG: diaminopimelate epimerase [Bacteroidetes bacterium]|nr:diaminopimelate epimerase [Bacteroidota bacterium]HET6244292.1 diaminopimelate epimerase [Bacteroidia bacterium]